MVGMMAALMGIILITLGGKEEFRVGGRAFWGDLISLAAASMWGLNNNLQRPLVRVYPSTQVALISVVVGGICLLLIAARSMVAMDWAAVPTGHWAVVVLSGLLSIGLANMIWVHGVKRLGPSRTANFINLVPVIAFAVSYFFLGERYSALQFIGAGVTLCGVWLVRR